MLSYAQEIYSYLRKAGMTQAGALGVMRNLQAESGLYPCRLQGDYRTGFEASKLYAEKVDSGEISKYNFCHDAKGWGLALFSGCVFNNDVLRPPQITVLNDAKAVFNGCYGGVSGNEITA